MKIKLEDVVKFVNDRCDEMLELNVSYLTANPKRAVQYAAGREDILPEHIQDFFNETPSLVEISWGVDVDCKKTTFSLTDLCGKFYAVTRGKNQFTVWHAEENQPTE